MAPSQPGIAAGAGEPEPRLQVLDGDGTFSEVDIFDCNAEGFGDTAPQMTRHPNQQPVTEVGGRFLQKVYFF